MQQRRGATWVPVRRAAVVAVLVAVALGAGGGGSAVAQDPGISQLQVSDVAWEVGDEVTISGTACDPAGPDPLAGAGAEVVAVAFLTSDPTSPRFGPPAPVDADGSFTIGPVTVAQPLFAGDATLEVRCVRGLGTPEETSSAPYAPVEVTRLPPTFEFPASGVAGDVVPFPSPCELGPAEQLTIELLPTFSIPTYFLERIEGPVALGQPVAIPLPVDAPDGSYRVAGAYVVRATCTTAPQEPVGGFDPFAVFAERTFRLDPAGADGPLDPPPPALPDDASSAPSAAPAAPRPGAAGYTG